MDIQPSYCQISEALDIIVGKWKPVILMNLMETSPLRFNELRKRIPDITQKMLTKHLRELETEDIIKRKIYPEIPPKVEYSITDYGKTLFPVLNMMHEWGIQHKEHKEVLQQQNSPDEKEEFTVVKFD